ncbi:MAG: carbon monoxide dehydrogenase protein, partial [Nocardioides sp.]|nr:carbon monoxide dehydrogenase protein [Nocardioides sp.]
MTLMPIPPTPGPLLLRGVDRAALAAGLGARLRSAGVPVSVAALTAFTDALATAPPVTVRALYWLARLTLVSRHDDLAVFDRVFDAVFGEAVLPVDPHARRRAQAPDAEPPGSLVPVPARGPGGGSGRSSDLPWHTLPSLASSEEPAEGDALPELLPSALARVADTPLDELDVRELAVVGRWLEGVAHRWPSRRGRRQQIRASGRRLALRETIAASRRTGWEPIELRHYHPVRRPLTVTLLCDVSQSMQSYATAYLHLMRVFARTGRAETFAFSTSLTRLTPVLSHRSAEVA